MRLIEKMLSKENVELAMKKVKSNKGAPGVDKMMVDEIDEYFIMHGEEVTNTILNMKYKPKPVRRVYIPKTDGKQRPLGIPTVIDRVIQQALAQILSEIYEPHFSENSYGFRPNRSAHDAMEQVLEYLNEGYEWVIDMDIEKYFDTVHHDKLISILREHVNEKEILYLIRSFLKAGVMEDGLISPNETGVPQGGPLSPILSNIKIRVVIIKQWKIPKRIYINLQRLNKLQKFSFTEEDIFKVANSRLGWYRKCGMDVVNFILSPKALAIKKKERPGLVNPLEYYLSRS